MEIKGEGYNVLVWQEEDGYWRGRVTFPDSPIEVVLAATGIRGYLLKEANIYGKLYANR